MQKPPSKPAADTAMQMAASPAPGQPSAPSDAVAKQAQGVVGREGQVSQKAVDAAKNDTAKVFDQKIAEKLTADWRSWNNPAKQPLEDFIEDARQRSNSFDPKSEFTAKIIGGKDYKEYLKTYNAYLALNSIGDDLANAIQMSKTQEFLAAKGLGKYVGQEGVNKQREDRDRLIQGIYIAMTGDMKEPDAKTKTMIDEKLYDLMKSPGDAGSKKARLFEMLEKQYGYRADLLRQYGLSGE
jgi:hypothetical protein